MRERKKPGSWFVKAELPVGWQVPIRAKLMGDGRELGQWLRDAIREKAEREGIQLPEDSGQDEESDDAA